LKYEYVVETGLVEGATQLGHTNSITVNRGVEASQYETNYDIFGSIRGRYYTMLGH
jgi:hypothetical protein